MLIWCDNSTTVSCVNRGSSLDEILKVCFTAVHVPGVENVLTDMISRLHEPYSRHYLRVLLVMSSLSCHMLYNCFLYLE